MKKMYRSKKEKIIERKIIVKSQNKGISDFITKTRSNFIPGPEGNVILVHGISGWVEESRVEFLE